MSTYPRHSSAPAFAPKIQYFTHERTFEQTGLRLSRQAQPMSIGYPRERVILEQLCARCIG